MDEQGTGDTHDLGADAVRLPLSVVGTPFVDGPRQPVNPATRPAIRVKEPKNGTPGPVNASVNPWRARAEHVAHVLPTLCGLGCRSLAEARHAPSMAPSPTPRRGSCLAAQLQEDA